MSHHHHSHHERPHHHDHPPDDAGREPSAESKLATILEHWIKHNESHAQAYQEWAQKASALSMHADDFIFQVIGKTLDFTKIFNQHFSHHLCVVLLLVLAMADILYFFHLAPTGHWVNSFYHPLDMHLWSIDRAI